MRDIYGGRPPFEKGSKTSEAAANAIEHVAAAMKWRVLAFIQRNGVHGATDDEIEVALDMRHQTASARRRDLVLESFVVGTGLTRRTRSGRKAEVWVATSFAEEARAGQQALGF